MQLDQSILNWILAVLGIGASFLLTALWNAVKDLQKADREMAEKVSQVEILVAGEYVRQTKFDSVTTALFKKLDRIEDKLDHKVDKDNRV